MKARNIKFLAHAARWFDRTNGNTYHSCRIVRVRDGAVITCPLQYGYGDCYRQTALKAMCAAKWIPVKYRGNHANGSARAWPYEMENNYPIAWTVTDGLKREAIDLAE